MALTLLVEVSDASSASRAGTDLVQVLVGPALATVFAALAPVAGELSAVQVVRFAAWQLE